MRAWSAVALLLSLLPGIARAGGAFADESYLRGLEALEEGNLRRAQSCFEACARAPVAEPATGSPAGLDARANVTQRLAQEARNGEDPSFRTGKYAAALRARARNRLGDIARAQGRLDEARALYEEAVGLDGEYPMVHANLGRLLAAAGEHERAMALLERAYRMAPTWDLFREMCADTIARSASARARAGEIGAEDAEAQYLRAISLDAYNEVAQILLGRSFYRRGDREKGLFVLSRAAEQQRGGNRRACIVYSEILLEDGQDDRALEYAQRACATPDAPGTAHRAFGAALAQAGRGEEALSELYQAAASMPRDAATALHLGKAYQRLGWTDHARRAFQTARGLAARGLDPDGSNGAGLEATYRLGYVHFERGDLALAATLLGEAADAAPALTRWLDHARECRRKAEEVIVSLPAAQ
ncbi:MAG: tetratricopeptide repeat protein [Planctomycetes bacterium]|nr:tetratricopeptide repeat protein [Planctomycetota bacterium]